MSDTCPQICLCQLARLLLAMERRENITQISVNSEILCTVQHVLEDLIVVTFISPNNKPFQGVLLDSTKR